MKTFYRYDIDYFASCFDESMAYLAPPRAELSLKKFYLLKETPKTWCVIPEYYRDCIRQIVEGEKVLCRLPKKYILKSARKKFAYPTIEEAANSFFIRKTRQVKILSEQLDRARQALEIARAEVGRVENQK